MARRSAAAALLLLAAGVAACAPTDTASPPPFDPGRYPPIRLAVGGVEVASVVAYPAGMGFIARRRSEQLAQDAQSFLRARLVAAGGPDLARATVEEATLVERARPTGDGALATVTEPDWEMAGVLALKVAVVDGLGIEQGYATSRVEIKRSIPRRAGVEAKDEFARTIIADLIAASDRELGTSVDQNLAGPKAAAAAF